MRILFATIFVCWPAYLLIKLLAIVSRPTVWAVEKVGCHKLSMFLSEWTIRCGLLLYYGSTMAAYGKERAQLSLLLLMVEDLHGGDRGER